MKIITAFHRLSGATVIPTLMDMPRSILNTVTFLSLALATLVSAAENDGWRPLFNGKDLTGWVPVQVAPNTFTVRDGIIVSTGVPTALTELTTLDGP